MSEDTTYPEKETAFSSPVPMLNSLKRIIFGHENPSLLLRIMIYFNILIWLIFFIWHVLSFFAIDLRTIILAEKGINVEVMILNRGSALGYDPSIFLENLLMFNRLSILCWMAVFISIVLMWRKKLFFAYIMLGAIATYYATMIYFLGTTFYLEDTTFFDKIAVIILVVNSLIFLYLVKIQDETGARFFKLDDDEADEVITSD